MRIDQLVMLWLTRIAVPDPFADYQEIIKNDSPCYDELGQPQYCTPPSFCLFHHAESLEITEWNDNLDKYETRLARLEDMVGKTWKSKQREIHPGNQAKQVTLTLNLENKFHITSLVMEFDGPRPHSFAIYRKPDRNEDWQPYQFFSSNCTEFYQLPDSSEASDKTFTGPLCTSNFTQMEPLKGGKAWFSPLQISKSPDWTYATALRITFDRPNIPESLSNRAVQYSYAISNITVEGTLVCNGHAENYVRFQRIMECSCRHNTEGSACEQCQQSYVDVPWKPATKEHPTECKKCNCGGYAWHCDFDEQLYNSTGHGGRCQGCRGNRSGANCEQCIANYCMEQDICVPCASTTSFQ